MKLKLILEPVDSIDLNLSHRSRLELELSEANIVSRGTTIENTDELPEGVNNLYFTNERVAAVVQPMLEDLETIPDLSQDVNQLKEKTSSIENQLIGIDELLTRILGEWFDYFR